MEERTRPSAIGRLGQASKQNWLDQAGTVHHLTVDSIRRCIENVGYIPRQRNVFYDYIDQAGEYRPQQPGPVLPVLQS